MKPRLEDHLKRKTTIIEENAKDAPVKDIEWEAQEIESEKFQMIDPGVGKEVVLRSFFFKSAPIPKGFPKPTKAQIVSHFKKLIETKLWQDGLAPLEHRVPQVTFLRELKKGQQLRSKMQILHC